MQSEYFVDVLIAGGGTSGVSAAVGAAQAGANVLLIERNAYLGGEGTHAGVGALCAVYTCGDNPVKCVAGVCDLVLNELHKLSPDSTETAISAAGNKNINFKPEYMKVALDNLLDIHNVKYFLHTNIIEVKREGNLIKSVTCQDDESRFIIHAKSFIDATGDANIAHMSGAKTLWGDERGQVMTATLPFRLCGVDISKDMSPNAVEKAVKKAKDSGINNLTRERGFILKISGSHEVIVLLPSVIPEGLSAEEITHMEKFTRSQVLSYVEAFKKFMPGMENCELSMIGPSIGFRETRRLAGKYMLTADDVLNRRKSPEGIGRGGWKPEIHSSLNEAAVYLDVPGASYYDIPLGCIESVDTDNLFGCGRLICADSQAMAASRVMGTCFATGHAAGVAGAVYGEFGKVDVNKVREELLKQNALI